MRFHEISWGCTKPHGDFMQPHAIFMISKRVPCNFMEIAKYACSITILPIATKIFVNNSQSPFFLLLNLSKHLNNGCDKKFATLIYYCL